MLEIATKKPQAEGVVEAFELYDRALLLDPDERQRAEVLHGEITATLKAAGVIISAFLQGSLARKTMVAPLRDIDKVVIMAPAWNHLRIDPRGGDLAMDLIEGVISAKWSAAHFTRTKHSLKLDFGDGGFCFDIVPAFETLTDDDDVEIADRTNGWKRSNTRALMRAVSKRNQLLLGRFIHQARMVKAFTRNHLGEEFPGLHTESIAYRGLTRPLTHPDAVLEVLSAGAVILRGDYYDPTGVDLLSRRLAPGVRQRAQSAFERAALQAREAKRLAAAGDEGRAVGVWAAVMGEPFPAGPDQSIEDAFRLAGNGGSVTSAGAASFTVAGRQIARPTRSWRP